MGQKVHPVSLRLGIVRDWESRWYATREHYAEFLHEDIEIRKFIRGKYSHAGIDRIEIERAADRVKITVHTARPGIVIGPKGSEIAATEKDLAEKTSKQVKLLVAEVKKPELSAQLVAENIAGQLMRRISFRRAMKKTIQASMDAGALGVKIACGGRLAGAEMARAEWYRKGRVPLHTLRADIDYGFMGAKTKYGMIGVKVWVFKGEIFGKVKPEAAEAR
ncbi:30S ribosomal protein S3 [Candidatus Sumerlaeota bacterium]|nr:30S ribosomal protein S3 [Candidatus Sumerlaeota bacterium]